MWEGRYVVVFLSAMWSLAGVRKWRCGGCIGYVGAVVERVEAVQWVAAAVKHCKSRW